MMGPWYHVSDHGGLHLQALQLRWFEHWLKDDARAAIAGKPLTFQAIGSSNWYRADDYPLAEATPTRFYLSDAGRLSSDASPHTTVAPLTYVPRGPLSGRSLEQWSLGLSSFLFSQRGRTIRYDQDNRRLQRGAPTPPSHSARRSWWPDRSR